MSIPAFENPRSLIDGAFALPAAEDVGDAVGVLAGATVPVPLAMVGDGVSPAVTDAAMMIPLLVTTAAVGTASLRIVAGAVGCGEGSAFRR